MFSPIHKVGGKGQRAKRIIKYFPAHKIYVEPYCGGASVFFAKEPVAIEVLNDLDHTLIDFFKVLREPALRKILLDALRLTPYARADYQEAYNWREEPELVERMRKWYIVNRQAVGGIYGAGWSLSNSPDTVRRGVAMHISAWLSAIDGLPEAAARLLTTQLECRPAIECFSLYDSASTLFYCDPPYIHETRKDISLYKYEMSLEEHEQLVQCLLKIKGSAVLSGYKHPIYDTLLTKGWSFYKFTCKTGTSPNAASSRIECLYIKINMSGT